MPKSFNSMNHTWTEELYANVTTMQLKYSWSNSKAINKLIYKLINQRKHMKHKWERGTVALSLEGKPQVRVSTVYWLNAKTEK